MISPSHKFNIIHSSINFIRTISQAYGSDEGMKLWETISNTLDPDIKGQIFMAMLSGEYRAILYVSSCRNYALKTEMVRAIRKVDGSSLKEAIALVNNLISGKSIEIRCDPKRHEESIMILREAGLNI